MKAGMVSQIRVNSVDCQRVLDLMQVIGVDPYDGRSFAQCVSLALSSMLDTMARSGIIPAEVDTFQYLNRMGPFLNSGNNKKKARAADSLYGQVSKGYQIAGPTIPSRQHNPGQYIPEHLQGQGQAMGWTANGPVTSARVPLAPDPVVMEAVQEEYAELMELIRAGEPSEGQLKRFSELQTLLFP